MNTMLSPVPKLAFIDINGNPLVGGKLYTYIAGTTTPLTTYTDSTGTAANTNPVILDTRGEANVWITPGFKYKFILYDSLNVLIWSVDNISAADPYGIRTSNYDTFADALAAAANNVLIVDSYVNITTNTTIPSTVAVEMQFPYRFTVSTAVTLTIAGPFNAPSYWVFARNGSGKVRLGTGRIINILWYVTSGTGSAVTPFIGWEWAINDLDPSDVGTEFVFTGDTSNESGVYKATSTLLLQQSCMMRGTGKGISTSPKVLGSHLGAATVSLKAQNYCTIKDLIISGDITTPPKTGLLLGRNSASSSAGGHYFENIGVRGYWSKAAIYSIGSEDVNFQAIDMQLSGGGAIYGFYTSELDNLNVDNLGYGSNSHVTVRNFVFANEVDNANAATIYMQCGTTVLNWLFDGGWIGAYRGRYVQLNAGGLTIGNLAGPIEFNCISGESGNAVNPPNIGFDLTVPIAEVSADFNHLTIKNCNFQYQNASGIFVKGASGASTSTLLYCWIENSQNRLIQLHSAKTSYFKTIGSVSFLGTAYGNDVYGINTAIGNFCTITGAGSGNRFFDAESRGQLTPIKGYAGSSGGAVANASSVQIMESNASQYLSFLSPSSQSAGLLFSNPTGINGGWVYNNQIAGFELTVANFLVYVYVGSGTPEAQITAPRGSLFLNTLGGAGTTLYVKESGSGNTGWVGK